MLARLIGEVRTAKRAGLRMLRVWLTPQAWVALVQASAATGDSHADTVNRALQHYRDSVINV
jgi:hypothetical protein